MAGNDVLKVGGEYVGYRDLVGISGAAGGAVLLRDVVRERLFCRLGVARSESSRDLAAAIKDEDGGPMRDAS